MYIAKMDISEFKEGDEVPEDRALIWMSMYVDSPVKKCDEGVSSVKKEILPDMKVPEPVINSVKSKKKSSHMKK